MKDTKEFWPSAFVSGMEKWNGIIRRTITVPSLVKYIKTYINNDNRFMKKNMSDLLNYCVIDTRTHTYMYILLNVSTDRCAATCRSDQKYANE